MSSIIAILCLVLLIFLLGFLISLAYYHFQSSENTLVDAINQCLPQTQCAQCHYPGCLPYAKAIAEGEAINRCPPGGEATIHALAELLGKPIIPLDDALSFSEPRVAIIREEDCIGCAKCIEACPVDAIVGTAKWMHTVITDECTGCDLCLPPCPVDCIDMIPKQQPLNAWHPIHPKDLIHSQLL